MTSLSRILAGSTLLAGIISSCVPLLVASPTPAPTLRLATPTASPRPGGPDDASVLQLAAMSGWPSSLAEIPEMRAAGGPFSFDPEAPNVQAQLAAVEGFVTRAGYQPVETPEELTSGRTSYVAPVQDQDQWSIQCHQRW